MATDEGDATTSDIKKVGRCFKKLKPLLGIGIVAASALFFCISNVIVKNLSHVDFFMISCIRFFTMFMMSSPMLMSRVEIKNHPTLVVNFKESPFPSGKRWLLFWRSILGASDLTISYYAVQVSSYFNSLKSVIKIEFQIICPYLIVIIFIYNI